MLNTTAMIGYVASEVNVNKTSNGKTVAKMRIRHSTGRRERDDPDKWESHFFTVEGWEKTAEKMENLTKGDMVSVTGRLSVNSYEDRDGVKREQVLIVATEVQHLKPGESKGEGKPNKGRRGGDLDNDVPF